MVQSRTTPRVAARGAIKALGLAGAISITLTLPGTAPLWEELEKYNRGLRKRKRDAARTLAYLKYRKLVEAKEKEGQIQYKLTSKGIDRFNKLVLDELTIPPPKRWDHKWRLVMFDIPKELNSKRNSLLIRLRGLGFYKLQHSAWIHPFECEKQVGVIIHHLGLEKFVSFILIENGNFTDHAEDHFKKSGLLI